MRLFPAILTISCFAALPASARGPSGGGTMSFKNNLLPGQLTEHRVKRVTRRTMQKGDVSEVLTYQQNADWLHCNIDEPKPGSAMLYQMMVDHPPTVVKVTRDGKKVSPTPEASQFNLPLGSTRLHSSATTSRDAEVQAPITAPVQQAVLTGLLDFAHWPAGTVVAGHRWQRDFSCEGFAGTQTFEFVDTVKLGDTMTARVTLFVEGHFTGGLEREYSYGKGQALMYWSRPDRTLLKMEGQADYERNREGKPDQYHLKLNVDLATSKQLTDDEQEQVKVELTVFAEALKKYRAKDVKSTLEICRNFRSQWPKSRWLPAVAELEAQAAPKPSEQSRLSADQLKKVLMQTIVAWEAARTSGEHDLQEKARGTLAQVAIEYRVKLEKLARDKDSSVRSQAVFALAMGKNPEDAAIVQKAINDKSPTVRAMALAGCVARGRSDIHADLLIARLDDDEAGVRRRACQAVAACVPPEHFSIVKIVEKLDHLMVYDDSDLVRKEAIRALAVVGAPADIPRLEKALTHEMNHDNRDEIEKAIKALRNKG